MNYAKDRTTLIIGYNVPQLEVVHNKITIESFYLVNL